MEENKKIRQEIIDKWEKSGYLDGIKGPIKNEKILALYQCCKSYTIKEMKKETDML